MICMIILIDCNKQYSKKKRYCWFNSLKRYINVLSMWLPQIALFRILQLCWNLPALWMYVVLCSVCLPSLYICCAVTLTIILLWFANHVKKGKEYNTCSKVSDLLAAFILYTVLLHSYLVIAELIYHSHLPHHPRILSYLLSEIKKLLSCGDYYLSLTISSSSLNV